MLSYGYIVWINDIQNHDYISTTQNRPFKRQLIESLYNTSQTVDKVPTNSTLRLKMFFVFLDSSFNTKSAASLINRRARNKLPSIVSLTRV